MTVRVLCDENVEPGTVAELEARGIAATHVTDRPGAGADDEEVAAHAIESDAILVTNDDDFLDQSLARDVHVFYYPENHLAAHQVARRVEAALEVVANANELPGALFLTAAYDDA